MKIRIERGDVAIREVKLTEHSRGVYTLDFHAPFDSAVAVAFNSHYHANAKHLEIQVFGARRDRLSAVWLQFANDETRALQAWFMGLRLHYSDRRHWQTILAVPDGVLDRRGGVVAESRADLRVDYLESLT